MTLRANRIAFVVANEFDEQEFKRPYERLSSEGATIDIIGIEADQQLISHHRQEDITTNMSFDDANPGDYDAVVIPGGYSPDKLRLSKSAVAFVKVMYETGKIVAAICHAPSLLVDTGILKGMTITSWPSIRMDLLNAGAKVVDAEVAIDGNLITSRNVSDVPAFTQAIINMLESRNRMRAAS